MIAEPENESYCTAQSLSAEFLNDIISDPNPEYYDSLWNVSWRYEGPLAESLYRAMDKCYLEDFRSTDELLRVARSTGCNEKSGESIRALQRRGGLDVCRRAAFLVEYGSVEDKILGVQLLGRLGDRRSFLKPYVLRILCGALSADNQEVSCLALRNILVWCRFCIADLVRQTLAHSEPSIRKSAEVVLFGMKDPNSIEGLMGLLTARQGSLKKYTVTQIQETVLGGVGAVNAPWGTQLGPSNPALALQAKNLAGYARIPAVPRKISKRRFSSFLFKKSILPSVILGLFFLILLATQSDLTGLIGEKLQLGRLVSTVHDGDAAKPVAAQAATGSYQPSGNPFEVVSLKGLLRDRALDSLGKAEALQVQGWLGLRDQSIDVVLQDKRKIWSLYHRLHPQLAAAILAPAYVPTTDDSPVVRRSYRYLIANIAADIHNGSHEHGASLLQYLALLNGRLVSYLLAEVGRHVQGLFFDDFVESVGSVAQGTPESRFFSGLRFHPGLTNLTHEGREIMIEALLTGWVTKNERELAVYLDELNYSAQLTH